MSESNLDAKYIQMTQTPVERLICCLAVPTIISNLITTFYNMADTFFIGKINTSASGAVGIAFSVMAVIQAIGFFFGQGSGNNISRELGRHETEKAERLAATGFYSALIFGAACGRRVPPLMQCAMQCLTFVNLESAREIHRLSAWTEISPPWCGRF